MFYRFNRWQKVIILCLLYILISLICYLLFLQSISEKNIEIILYVFIQIWNLMLIGFFFLQAFKYFRLPQNYYQKIKIESATLYKIFGVNLFRIVLINSFFRHLNKRVYLKGKSTEYLKVFVEETKQSETSHIISMMCTLIIQIIYLNLGYLYQFYWLSIFTILLNIYPILLQRMNRHFIEKKYPNILVKRHVNS